MSLGSFIGWCPQAPWVPFEGQWALASVHSLVSALGALIINLCPSLPSLFFFFFRFYLKDSTDVQSVASL